MYVCMYTNNGNKVVDVVAVAAAVGNHPLQNSGLAAGVCL